MDDEVRRAREIIQIARETTNQIVESYGITMLATKGDEDAALIMIANALNGVEPGLSREEAILIVAFMARRLFNKRVQPARFSIN